MPPAHTFEDEGEDGNKEVGLQLCRSCFALKISSPMYALMIALILRAIVVLVACYSDPRGKHRHCPWGQVWA